MLNPEALLALVTETLDDIKAENIVVIAVGHITSITDNMIICTGNSSRHVKSISQRLVEAAKHKKHPPLGVEGEDDGEWVLVDLGDAVVHILQAKAREFYDLERLWSYPAKHITSS